MELEMWANAQRDGRPTEYRCSTPQFGYAKPVEICWGPPN